MLWEYMNWSVKSEGSKSKCKFDFFENTHLIVLNSSRIKNLYNIEPPIIQHVPIIEHIFIS
jgi:hypothetical protein